MGDTALLDMLPFCSKLLSITQDGDTKEIKGLNPIAFPFTIAYVQS